MSRRDVMDVIAAVLWHDANLVDFMADVSEVGEEFRETIRLGVLELTKRVGGADRREDLRPRCHAALVQSEARDLMCEDVKGESMDMERLEIVLLCGLDCGKRLDRVIR